MSVQARSEPNLCRYASGDPVNRFDPLGMSDYNLAAITSTLGVVNQWMGARIMNAALGAAAGCGLGALEEALNGGTDVGRACKRKAVQGAAVAFAGDVAGGFGGTLFKATSDRNMCLLGGGLSLAIDAFEFAVEDVGFPRFRRHGVYAAFANPCCASS